MKISGIRLVLFIILLVILLFIYYKFLIKDSGKISKSLNLLRFIFNLLIVSGSLKALYDIKTDDGKLLVIIILALLINFYNLRYNIKKCNYQTLYKIKLTFRSSFIIILSIVAIWYSLNNDIYSFLYIENDEGEKDWFYKLFGIDNIIGSIDIEDNYDIDLSYCPDMRKQDYKNKDTSDYGKWNALSNEEQNNCLTKIITKIEREDVDAGIYA